MKCVVYIYTRLLVRVTARAVVLSVRLLRDSSLLLRWISRPSWSAARVCLREIFLVWKCRRWKKNKNFSTQSTWCQWDCSFVWLLLVCKGWRAKNANDGPSVGNPHKAEINIRPAAQQWSIFRNIYYDPRVFAP